MSLTVVSLYPVKLLSQSDNVNLQFLTKGKEKLRPRSQSAAGRLLKEEHDMCESNFIPEEDSSERYSDSEEEYEGDEEEVDDDDMDNGDSTIEQEGEIYGDNEQGHLHEKMISEINADSRFRWHTVSVNGREKVLDLKLLEPYMKVISHGGMVRNLKLTPPFYTIMMVYMITVASQF